jgi:hypothetical protein
VSGVLAHVRARSATPGLVTLLVGALAACGAESPRPRAQLAPAPREPIDGGADAATEAATDAATDIPSAARIAESGAAVAPGMRELARVDDEAPLERPLLRAAERDTCVRVAFAGGEPLAISLVDGAGAVLDATPRAASGVTSTVCVKRAGDVVLRVARAGDGGPGGRVRAVAFAAP